MQKIYLAVTNDKYELPVAVFDSTKEAAEWVGMARNDILVYIRRQHVNKKYNIRFVKVEIDEEK